MCILDGEIFYFCTELDESDYNILDSITKQDSSIQIFIKENFLRKNSLKGKISSFLSLSGGIKIGITFNRK